MPSPLLLISLVRLAPIVLTWNEALSGIWGSVSLASWIFLLVPQLIENYQQGHADGISMTFLFIWMVGDVTNLAGAIWAGLVPTVIAIAAYFCFSDLVLITQCTYYNTTNRRKEKENKANGVNGAATNANERTPLLNDNAEIAPPRPPRRKLTDVTDDNMGLPGSRRKSSTRSRRIPSSAHVTTLERALEEPTPTSAWLKNTLSILAVCAVGAGGWAIAWKTGAWRPTPEGREDDGKEPIGAEILGYISAVCYLGARIPQIIKNQRDRSCEGLSLLFFLLSILGNATYGAGILFHSTARTYVIKNTPWLIGSLGTMVEDVIIFIQFSAFGDKRESAVE